LYEQMKNGLRRRSRDLVKRRMGEQNPTARRCKLPFRRAGPTGRCNTIQCIASAMLPQENRSLAVLGQDLARAAFLLV
jgi:hypothetical protein